MVAGGRFIGPKSATPLASCPHGRQGLFPVLITAFHLRFSIQLRRDEVDMFLCYQSRVTEYLLYANRYIPVFLLYIHRGTVDTVYVAFSSTIIRHGSITSTLGILTARSFGCFARRVISCNCHLGHSSTWSNRLCHNAIGCKIKRETLR